MINTLCINSDNTDFLNNNNLYRSNFIYSMPNYVHVNYELIGKESVFISLLNNDIYLL